MKYDRYIPPCIEQSTLTVERGFAATENGAESDGFDDGGKPNLDEWD